MRPRCSLSFPMLALIAAFAAPATVVGDTPAPASAPVARRAPQGPGAQSVRPLTPDERLVADVRDAGARQVQTLMQSYGAASNDAARRDIQRQISAAKLNTEVQVLRTRASIARTHGDLAGAQELDMIVERILHPAVPGPSIEQTPNKSVSKEGGKP